MTASTKRAAWEWFARSRLLWFSGLGGYAKRDGGELLLSRVCTTQHLRKWFSFVSSKSDFLRKTPSLYSYVLLFHSNALNFGRHGTFVVKWSRHHQTGREWMARRSFPPPPTLDVCCAGLHHQLYFFVLLHSSNHHKQSSHASLVDEFVSQCRSLLDSLLQGNPIRVNDIRKSS